jgi:hypothetical protein
MGVRSIIVKVKKSFLNIYYVIVLKLDEFLIHIYIVGSFKIKYYH